MYPLTALYQLYQLFWLIIDITTQQLFYNLSPTSTIHEIHHRSSTLISELLLIESIQLHNHGTIIINFIDVITIGRLDPVTLSVPLVSCRGSCVTPCRQPCASKRTPTTRCIQVGIATRTVVSQRTVLSTLLLYYEQQQWTRDCAHSCWTSSSLQLERSSVCDSSISSILFFYPDLALDRSVCKLVNLLTVFQYFTCSIIHHGHQL